MNDIKGKKVLITGGAKGIGFHTAQIFAQNGAQIIITDINKNALNDAQKKLQQFDGPIHTYVVDVSDQKQVENLAKDIIKQHKGIDVLINNAGVGLTKEMADMSLEEWKKQIGVNLWGPLYHMYSFLPDMLGKAKGQIVNVSSGQAFFRLPTWGAYAAIKLCLGGLSNILYYELRSRGIQVTTIYPFMVNTGFYNKIKDSEQTFGTKLAMKLLPYYSNKPETLGKKIFQAVKKKKKTEMVHILNWVAYYMWFIPFLANIVGYFTFLFLGKKRPDCIEKSKIKCLINMIQERRLSFQMDEVMTGQHEFIKNNGPLTKGKMEFRITWGPKSIFTWINPFSQKFMSNNLVGRVDIEGLCEGAIVQGIMDLKYFTERKIRYTFYFEVNGKKYQFVGEKVNILPWNLHKSHTTCYGKLTEIETGELVSNSITYFRLRTLPSFIWSLRLG